MSTQFWYILQRHGKNTFSAQYGGSTGLTRNQVRLLVYIKALRRQIPQPLYVYHEHPLQNLTAHSMFFNPLSDIIIQTQ